MQTPEYNHITMSNSYKNVQTMMNNLAEKKKGAKKRAFSPLPGGGVSVRNSGAVTKQKREKFGGTFFQGFCYLALFHRSSRKDASAELGRWPTVKAVRSALDRLELSLGPDRVSAMLVTLAEPHQDVIGYHVMPGMMTADVLLNQLPEDAVLGGDTDGEVDNAPIDSDPAYADVPNEAADPENDDAPPVPPSGPDPGRTDNPDTEYARYPVTTVVADKPENEASLEGWLEWQVPGTNPNGTVLGGGKYATTKDTVWQSRVGKLFGEKVPYHNQLTDQFHTIKRLSFGNATVGMSWGYGQINPIDIATRARYEDSRAVAFWSASDKMETVSATGQQIMYNTPVAITPSGRANALSSLLAPDEIDTIRELIGVQSTADEYIGNAMSIMAEGDTHMAMLVIAYTRLLTLVLATEQGVKTTIAFKGEEFEDYKMPLPPTGVDIYRRIASTLNLNPQANVVYMPAGSRGSDVVVMAYLLGMGRIEANVTQDKVTKRIYSQFDRFVTREGFKIIPLIDGAEYTGRYTGMTRVGLTSSEAESVLKGYVNHHGLWKQLALARCMAMAMVGSPTFASLVELPKAQHSSDWLLGLQGMSFADLGSENIISGSDSMSAITTTTTLMLRSAEEVFLEAIVASTESAGVSVHAANFKNVVDQYLGEDLPWGISHAILPVIEKLFNVDCEDLAYHVDRNMTGCVSKLAVGFKNRVFRETSYLMLEQKPNSTALLAIQSKAVRDGIGAKRFVDARESRILNYLTGVGAMPGQKPLFYHDFYNDGLSDDRYMPRPVGSDDRYSLIFMESDPKIWRPYVSTDGYIIKGAEVTAFKDKEKKKLTGFEMLIQMVAERGEVTELDEEDLANIARPDYPELDGIVPQPEDPFSYENYGAVPSKGPLQGTPQPFEAWFEPDEKVEEKEVVVTEKKGGPRHTVRSRVADFEGFVPAGRRRGVDPSSLKGVDGFRLKTSNAYDVLDDGREQVLEQEDDEQGEVFRTKPAKKKKVKKVPQRLMKSSESTGGLEEQESVNRTFQYRELLPQSKEEAVRFIQTSDLGNMTEQEVRWLDEQYPRGKDAEIKRAPYTVGVLIKEIFSEGLTQQIDGEVRERLSTGIGGKNAWMVGICMAIYAHTISEGGWNELKRNGFLTESYKNWNSKFSSYNDILRNSWANGDFQFTNADFPQMLYIANLVGRPNRDVNWDAEDEKRSRRVREVNIWKNGKLHEATRAEKKERLMAFLKSEASLKVRKCIGFEEMYLTRYQWMIGGSMAGEKTVVDSDPVMKSRLEEAGFKAPSHSTKKHISEKVSFEHIKAVLELEPINMAKGHTKGNENGKLRAIYGSLYSQYVIGRYWSYHLEQNLSFRHASMNRTNGELLADIERRIEAAERGDWIVCLDYADFNASHSLDTMSMIIDGITEWAIGEGFKPTQEFLDITSWYSRSFKNSVYFNPESQDWVRVLSGLFSGLPQTTLINTVENGTLEMTYMDNLRKQGCYIEPLTCFRLGDDGWVSFATREEAELYLTAAKQGGVETNDIKQLLSKGRGEYLRLMYDQDGLVRGSPIRALANVCSGSVESSVPSVGKGKIQELYSNFAVIIRRGYNATRINRRFLKLAEYELNGGKSSQGKRKLSVQRLLYGTKESGGMGLIPLNADGKEPVSLRKIASLSEEIGDPVNDIEDIANVIRDLGKQKKFLASSDYIEEVQTKYQLKWTLGGKKMATSVLAARNAADGAQDSGYEHNLLRASAAEARVDASELAEASGWLQDYSEFNMSAEQIEETYRKRIVKDDRVLSTITPFIKIVRYLTKESFDDLIVLLSSQIEISEQALRQAFKSLSSLKGEDQDYMPIPWLCQELMGVLSKWRVVTAFTGDRRKLDPQWIKVLATRLRY